MLLSNPAALPVLMAALDDQEASVRAQAITSLGEMINTADQPQTDDHGNPLPDCKDILIAIHSKLKDSEFSPRMAARIF